MINMLVMVAASATKVAAFLPYAQDRTISDVGVIVKGSGSASASLSVNTDGTFSSASLTITPAFNDSLEWLPTGTNSDYDVMCEYVSGDHLTSGTEDTWLACSSVQTFAISISGGTPASLSGTFNLSFRDTGSGSAQFTATLSLTASITT